jgi:hypothetical protein
MRAGFVQRLSGCRAWQLSKPRVGDGDVVVDITLGGLNRIDWLRTD